MGKLLDSLKNYFENTPQDVLDKDWKEIEPLNEIGPDVFEYAEFVKRNLGIAVSYPDISRKSDIHKYEVSANDKNYITKADAHYCLAA